jgi:DNA-directed RNA polymerase specialized sigma24 family protein
LCLDIYKERSEYKKLLKKKGLSDETVDDILSICYMKAITNEGRYNPNNNKAKSFRILFVLGRCSNYIRDNKVEEESIPECDEYSYTPKQKDIDIDQVLSMLNTSLSRRKHFKAVLEYGFVEAAKITGSKYATVKKDYEIVRQLLRDNKHKYL